MLDAVDHRRIAQAVNNQKRWLVETGDRIGESAAENTDLKHQIRLLLDASRIETEPLVLIQFLHYQAARNKNWRQPRDVETELAKAFEGCCDKANHDAVLAIALIRQLLTYIDRSFVYHTAVSESPARNSVDHQAPLEGEITEHRR